MISRWSVVKKKKIIVTITNSETKKQKLFCLLNYKKLPSVPNGRCWGSSISKAEIFSDIEIPSTVNSILYLCKLMLIRICTFLAWNCSFSDPSSKHRSQIPPHTPRLRLRSEAHSLSNETESSNTSERNSVLSPPNHRCQKICNRITV